jgi:uncharacterized protein (DUF1330 family)
MTAYVFVDVVVTDPAIFEKYKVLAPATIEKYGGRYIARGGKTVVLEGEIKPNRIVMLEFASVERAQAWYDSAEYREARAAREGGATMKMIAVEGV